MTPSAFLLISVSVALPGCLLAADDDGGPAPMTEPPSCGRPTCPDPDDPFVFDSEVTRFASGTALAVDYWTDASLADFTLRTRDPDVIDIQEIGASRVLVQGRGPGTGTLVAESSDGSRVLAELVLEVVAVADVELWFRTPPVADQPVDGVAALAGESDSLRVVYRSAAGEPLAGRSGFSATGQVEIEDPDQVPGRVSEAFVPGTRLAFAALAPGDGTLSVDLADGSSFTIPVEVVRSADSIDIVTMVLRDGELAASDQVKINEPVGADVVGTTIDGRFVLGVGATWSSSEPIDNWLDSNRGSELVFSVPRAGPLQITAQHAHLTVSRQITADAAAASRRAQ